MAKKDVIAKIKLQAPGGQATPAPPIGPALGQRRDLLGEAGAARARHAALAVEQDLRGDAGAGNRAIGIGQRGIGEADAAALHHHVLQLRHGPKPLDMQDLQHPAKACASIHIPSPPGHQTC